MQKSYFFCGIAGSGMLSLALIANSYGYEVFGSDRSRDQGNNLKKFTFIEQQGIALFPQDGTGLKAGMTTLVVSAAVEDDIPDVRAAKDLGIPIIRRAEFLASLFNASRHPIAVAGTSGKTTTTGMIGYALKELGHDPTVMNGGVFRNYAKESPYCSALTGKGDVFLTEADESDGSIALYNSEIALLNNVALDHKPLEELEELFGNFLGRAKKAVVNFDNVGARDLAKACPDKVLSFGLNNPELDLTAEKIKFFPDGVEALICYKGEEMPLKIKMAGRYNISNALAAIGVLVSMDVALTDACSTLAEFTGIKRRMEKIGVKNNITVFDDFAHNPDKITASLKSLKNFSGRLIVFFQPHGYGFLKSLNKELADSFSTHLDADDMLFLVDPYYAGGTVDRSVGSQDVLDKVEGPITTLCDDRADVLARILNAVKPRDRIVIMGARDDTLSEFAEEIFTNLP